MLKDFELEAVRSWYSEEELQSPEIQEMIRQDFRRVAYHEAGHAAMIAFLGHGDGHVDRVTICPTQENSGRVHRERMHDWFFVKEPSVVWEYRFAVGLRFIMVALAGKAAEIKADPDEEGLDQSTLYDCWFDQEEMWLLTEEDLKAELNGTESDLLKTEKIAGLLEKRYWPYQRIMNRATQYVCEILDLPEVWQFVKTLAGLLVEKGTIGEEEYWNLACKVKPYQNYPLWKRRLKMPELRKI